MPWTGIARLLCQIPIYCDTPGLQRGVHMQTYTRVREIRRAPVFRYVLFNNSPQHKSTAYQDTRYLHTWIPSNDPFARMHTVTRAHRGCAATGVHGVGSHAHVLARVHSKRSWGIRHEKTVSTALLYRNAIMSMADAVDVHPPRSFERNYTYGLMTPTPRSARCLLIPAET